MKKYRFIALFMLLLTGGIIWKLLENTRGIPMEPESKSTKYVADRSVDPSQKSPIPPSELRSDNREVWRRFEISVDKRVLDKAIETGDPSQWRPILGQARHFNVPREKGIALLLNYLDHPDLQLRLAVAEYLFELGSRVSGPVLIELLKSGADRVNVGVDTLATSARILHQYRYPVDADLIFSAYQATHDVVLLKYAQLLGSELAKPETKKRLLANGTFQSAMMMAGIMKLHDSESMAIYRFILEKSNRAEDREAASAALYRSTNDPIYFDYLIGVAEEKVGLRPRTEKTGGNTGRNSFMVLQQTVNPQSTQVLRNIEEHARKTGKSVEAGYALLGLFYFHKDYAYVDNLILDQFAGKRSEGILISSIWELAAARRTPAIEEAAKTYNLEAYEREFIRKAGRPVESWIFQYIPSEIPSYVRPSLTD